MLAGCDGDKNKPSPPEQSSETASTGDTGPILPPDSDGDGFIDEEDCEPQDASAFPGAGERCNGIDDDCDGEAMLSEIDYDADGFLGCDDCNDLRPESYPGAPDPEGDQLDTDCDGTDGQGAVLPAPFLTGEGIWRSAGLALSSGDIDGDGCDDLLVGEPGGWANTPPQDSAATLWMGCHPWDDGPETYEDNKSYTGYYVDIAEPVAIVHEAGWYGFRGRLLLFDETFGSETTPLLEVLGEYEQRINSVVTLGEPAQWLLIGRQGGPDWNSAFFLLDASRRGLVDFAYDEPDLVLETGTQDYYVSLYPGDVGDRDGDGHVDLGVVADRGERQARFFPQVLAGHTDDAPESWQEDEPGDLPNMMMRSGGDLDGDGRSEAVYSSLFADGAEPVAGRAYLIPWLGSGDYNLGTHAPTRIDGAFNLDWFGLDNEVDDIDGDGQNDLIISAPGAFTLTERPGKVMVFAGPLPAGTLTAADAAVVYVGEQWEDAAGVALATGDFDGSGRKDIAVGAPFADRDGLDDAGTVYVLIDPL